MKKKNKKKIICHKLAYFDLVHINIHIIFLKKRISDTNSRENEKCVYKLKINMNVYLFPKNIELNKNKNFRMFCFAF